VSFAAGAADKGDGTGKPVPKRKKKPLPEGYGAHYDDAGDRYFFNYTTGDSLWELEGYDDYDLEEWPVYDPVRSGK